MPQIEVKTTNSTQVWASPDGQRKIYGLTLDYKGQPVAAKTYSDQIATVGWSGTVETYEKAGRNGIETFVKQPPKEGGFSGGSSSQTPTQGSRSSGYQAKDEVGIKAMWAIGQAVNATKDKDDGKEPNYANVESVAQELFLMVDRVKAVTPDTLSDEPVLVLDKPDNFEKSVEDIANIFAGAQVEAEKTDEEDPWTPKT